MGVRKWFTIFLLVLLLGILLNNKMEVQASLEDNPYISFSPDGDAYTTNAGDKNYEWYEKGTMVHTGVKSSLRELQEGEHYYSKILSGEITVGVWEVILKRGTCIHTEYVVGDYFHGISYGTRCCRRFYYSGWFPHCADCGEVLNERFYYMSDEAAKSLVCVDLSKGYYYKCPHCDNLEQAVEQGEHKCKAVSMNRYFVYYDANNGNGYMPKSTHMYNNSTIYEGKEVTPQTTLNLNTYTRRGYRFVGWNTVADGSGQSFADGAVIYNLATEEGEKVTLYAQWEECHSIVQIDPAGGSYRGRYEVTEIAGVYGEKYDIDVEELLGPFGYVVHFNAMGGTPVEDSNNRRVFVQWSMNQPFLGQLSENTYTFGDREGIVDCLTAVYEDAPIILPETEKEGYSFGGWFMDEDCTKPAGYAGDFFLPGKDMTLYANWVDLKLISKDNYTVNGGKGAVDLTWSQKDSSEKVYAIYQQREEKEWMTLGSAENKENSYEAEVNMDYCGQSSSYTVPFSGFYKLTLSGAQGGNYLNRAGGLGGKVWAYVYLEKGEKLEYTIGGQNGFNGGGVGTTYANGGGYSIVTNEKRGVLLVAGGGGGALPGANGYAGGTEASVMETCDGESGASGGGGGYQGGHAGILEFHKHTEACAHAHVGSATAYGGCYTVEVPCGETEFREKEESRIFYYGNIEYVNGAYQPCYCVQCGSYSCIGHTNIKYSYHCMSCGEKYNIKQDACPAVKEYVPGCERDESYICGMNEGEVISVRPAYGGSSYINGEWCFNYGKEAGVQEGNGTLKIEAQQTGMQETNKLAGLEAADCAPPVTIDAASVKKIAVGETQIRIAFDRPEDEGTVYFHQVKSYDKNTGMLLCVSNQTVNTLISGVCGYYYKVDEYTDTCVDKDDNYYAETGSAPFLLQEVAEEVRYLHIAAVDKAGNIGNTTHIMLSGQDVIYWPLRTEKLELATGSNVKWIPESNIYFVKADGSTPVTIEFEGLLCGNARADYQITHTSLHITDEATAGKSVFTVITPKQELVSAGTFTYPMQSLQKSFVGEECLQDDSYTMTKRFNRCKSILLTQKFTIAANLDGHKIYLQPQVGAGGEKGMIYSDEETDKKNAIWLLADGQGPKIQGMEKLEDIEFLDYSEKETRRVQLRAEDFGSGLAGFYVEINNLENGLRKRYEDAEVTGQISFEVSGEEQVFYGEFTVTVYAVDEVGNETVLGTKLLGVGLSTYIERILEPHDGVFKRGESGILHIQTTGYVERVEVSFPKEFEDSGVLYDQTYQYEMPSYIQTEELEFMIPLTMPDGARIIQVKAYKSGTELESTPQLLTIQIHGSVLDELRTRLR